MHVRSLLPVLLVSTGAAQTVCQPTPAYSACEITFDLSAADQKTHPNPYLTAQISAELRSPRHRTINLPAFWDGTRMVIRFAPTEPGPWDFRIASNLKQYDNKQGQVQATPSESPGFLMPANGHHWMWTASRKAHLWMGDTSYRLAWLDADIFRKAVDTRAGQKFTHIRGFGIGPKDSPTFDSPDQPDHSFYQGLDERVQYMTSKGVTFDFILGLESNQLTEQFPTWQQRERYIRYLVARYSAFNVTWQLMQEFEAHEQGRAMAKELGQLLRKLDPYQHPKTAHSSSTSSPLLPDGWMDYVSYGSADDQLGSIEHQLYAVPFVNSEFAYEDTGAGRTRPHHVDSDAFRRRLWNASMSGQYPTFGNTGTYNTRFDPKYLESPGARAMTVWYDFMAGNRYWELEPYFDLDGGRAIALPGTEYIVYVEKPAGPIEVRVEKHGYDVKWMDPASGEIVPVKEFNSEKFVGEPPDRSHDWVLHISREGRKQGMLNSYKFESRMFQMQEVETAAAKVPFEIAEPPVEEFSASKPPRYKAKLKRETRGTRSMMYVWTGEVPTGAQGFRVLGTGADGIVRVPSELARSAPAVISIRLFGMNANGKLYSVDKIYRLAP